MRVIGYLIRKEFAQFFRDKANIRMLVVMPIIQLIVIPMAANYEVKHIKLAVVDQSHSSYSEQLIHKICSSGYIYLVDGASSYDEALQQLSSNKADMILEFPPHFERDLVRENKTQLALTVNAVNGQRAGVGSQYMLSILRDFNTEVRTKWVQFPKFNVVPLIQIEPVYWFNPHLNYKLFMVPGILVILLTMVGSAMAALNLVKEKEIGTIEQINVSPIRKYEFIVGKLIPFWIMGQIVLTLGLTVGYVFYGIKPEGHIGLIYLFSSVYLAAVLGLGFLVSTFVYTQQQAMLINFFIMMVCIMLSGLYTPIESMPAWAKTFTYINPLAYFVKVMRMVVMKGSGLIDILPSLKAISMMAVILIGLAVLNYRKKN